MLFFSRKKKPSLPAIGLAQAVGIVVYILIFAFTVQSVGMHMEHGITPILGMSFVLLTFCFSAALCGTLFLGYSAHLFFAQKKTKEAFKLPLWTLGWMAAFLVLFVVYGMWMSSMDVALMY